MSRVNVLVVGTGEYSTGYVHGQAARSDKGAGVIALTLFDLRRRGLVGNVVLAGTNGRKFAGIRRHFTDVIADRYVDLSVDFQSFPEDGVESDPRAYLRALATTRPGDCVIVVTPDDTHHEIATAAVQHGCHVLVAKPAVKSLAEHFQLEQASRDANVLVATEVHKRWDPIYRDARDRIQALGEFTFFSSYMSQPKSQLETFRAWAGKSSDISYYLNTHHIDFHLWAVGSFARPVRVTASSASGYAQSVGLSTEDVICLMVEFEGTRTPCRGAATYTASWIAPRSDVHSQQRFHYVGQAGELQVDQAHRGYQIATDEAGYMSPNPLFMKYTPSSDGYFAGQGGYGYRSIEAFIQVVFEFQHGKLTRDGARMKVAMIEDSQTVTAVLEAGRRSLDAGGQPYVIQYSQNGDVESLGAIH